jgi:predicted metalloprotease with PDZ domain
VTRFFTSTAASHRRLLFAAALLLAQPSMASDEVDPRIAEAIEQAVIRLSESGALDSMQNDTTTVSQSEKVRFELGAVVELDSGLGEAPILAITPGGSAEAMGLQIGDRIISINGLTLATSPDPGQAFAEVVNGNNGEIAVRVRRGDQLIERTGRSRPIHVPGFRITIRRSQ